MVSKEKDFRTGAAGEVYHREGDHFLFCGYLAGRTLAQFIKEYDAIESERAALGDDA